MTKTTRIHISSNRMKILAWGILMVPLLAYGQIAHSQGASPALDLDRSGEVDPNDVFLFASIWQNMYDIGARNFNISDYFPLDAGNRWHYSAGESQPTEDNFAFEVEVETETLPDNTEAIRVLNDYDDPGGTREGIFDLWQYDPSGNLFYVGFSNNEEIIFAPGFVLPPQSVPFSNGLAFGTNDQEVGETLNSNATATVQVNLNDTLSELIFDVTGTIQPTGFLQTFTTELGDFTDVLRLSFDVVVQAEFEGNSFDFNFFNNTVFFKEGIGPIAIDLSPDVNDVGALTIDMGTIVVNGNPMEIVAQ